MGTEGVVKKKEVVRDEVTSLLMVGRKWCFGVRALGAQDKA